MLVFIKVTVCKADSTMACDSDATVCYSSNECLFVEDTSSSSDSDPGSDSNTDSDTETNSKEQPGKHQYCMCKQKVTYITFL